MSAAALKLPNVPTTFHPVSAPSVASVAASAPAKAQAPKQIEDDTALLAGVDKATQKRILDVAVDKSPGVAWADISGLDTAKRALYEVCLCDCFCGFLF
jgi:hypothetical protein